MRLQLALNVADLEAAVRYYEQLFGVTVNKRKPGYANFSIVQPPLKLVLFERTAGEDRLNHLGVELFSADAVQTVAARQRAAGLTVRELQDNECCFARQDKAITEAPDGTMWEFYHVSDELDGSTPDDLPGDDPQGVDDAGQPAEEAQQDVDQKVLAEPTLQRCC
jgi:catechol 2,3-dioxygenase-like lactoylglutathione lyase family enzyme